MVGLHHENEASATRLEPCRRAGAHTSRDVIGVRSTAVRVRLRPVGDWRDKIVCWTTDTHTVIGKLPLVGVDATWTRVVDYHLRCRTEVFA